MADVQHLAAGSNPWELVNIEPYPVTGSVDKSNVSAVDLLGFITALRKDRFGNGMYFIRAQAGPDGPKRGGLGGFYRRV
jgi:hypothetical protein